MPSKIPLLSLSLLLLLLPPLYFLSAFPTAPPTMLLLHPSLASLPSTAKTWEIYPEDFYDGGGYVTFPWGRVRYWVMGPESGEKIVLIHGLSIPAIIWKYVAPSLAKKGYRVLVYDLYGRGYSDAPETTYVTALYTTQLALLMQHLKWDKAIVAGLSMGGAIAAAFTSHFPHLVDDKVILIASAGIIESEDLSKTAKFMSSPFVQSIASSTPVRRYLQHLANSSKPTIEDQRPMAPIIEIVRLQSAHLPYYNAAISSSLREGPIRGQRRGVLIVHGDRDTTVPPKYAPKIFSLLPSDTRSRSKLVTIPGAGHDLTISHPSMVVQQITSFVEGKDS
ncbi:Alpha/Beta hydrolase protein [Cyathus striatus]|nr:Alpha/Beta hydrolase protein [Cyathus striatus]